MAFARGEIGRREPDHAAADDEHLFRHENGQPRFVTTKSGVQDPEERRSPNDEETKGVERWLRIPALNLHSSFVIRASSSHRGIPQPNGSRSSSNSVVSAVTNAVPMIVGTIVPAGRSSQR